MQKIINLKVIPIAIAGFLSAVSFCSAVTLSNPLAASSFKELVDKIINFITIIGVSIAPIFILYAGFLFMTSGGEPGKLKTAKSILIYVVVGLAILFLAKGLIVILQNAIGTKG